MILMVSFGVGPYAMFPHISFCFQLDLELNFIWIWKIPRKVLFPLRFLMDLRLWWNGGEKFNMISMNYFLVERLLLVFGIMLSFTFHINWLYYEVDRRGWCEFNSILYVLDCITPSLAMASENVGERCIPCPIVHREIPQKHYLL